MPPKLDCDDLRFGNIIVNDSFNIVGIIDFEFTYVAPASFLGSPPWWLAGTDPFEWNDEDKKDYEAKMEIFLAELEEEETVPGDHAHALSRFMRECWADGSFWYNVAVRVSVKLPQVMTHCLRIEPFRSFLQKPGWDAEDEFDTIMLALDCMKIKPG
ncbi:hypothetical protein IWX90DRAFT_189142 [Phyllosticta citrichinensis]|uniref:Aminoglycoside phosphotransferase domain-containing protein n=1 Tax=Phyllosticta citrichinensis TaxID=1130410 RepID=A0ABR1XWF6_9PEZI